MMRSAPPQHHRTVSPPLTIIAVITVALGLVLGVLNQRGRGDQVADHRPQDNAIAPHLVIGALVLAAAVILTVVTRSLRWIWTPVSGRTGARIRATFGQVAESPTGVLRSAAVVALAVFVLYLLLRMGLQATAGLNPGFTVNAWGGPTRLGAFAAHGVDALACIGLACAVGHLVLRPAPST